MVWRYLVSFIALVLILVATTGRVTADDTSLHRAAEGIDVYLAVLPAEMIRGHPREHDESQMHGGIPTDKHHVMVALFDQRSGNRITNATIYARVIASDGTARGPNKLLERMIAGGAETFGNYFRFSGTGPFQINLQIRQLDSKRIKKVSFQWTRT